MENGLVNINDSMSSPSVTPTRPLTPPELKAESTENNEESLVLSATKTDSPSDGETSSIPSGHVTPPKSRSDETPKYLLNEDSNESDEQQIEAKNSHESSYEPVRATATDENLIASYESQINPVIGEELQNDQVEAQHSVCESTEMVTCSTDMIITEEAEEIMDVVINKSTEMDTISTSVNESETAENNAEDPIPCKPIPEINAE